LDNVLGQIPIPGERDRIAEQRWKPSRGELREGHTSKMPLIADLCNQLQRYGVRLADLASSVHSKPQVRGPLGSRIASAERPRGQPWGGSRRLR
jgi:hypothetical protein